MTELHTLLAAAKNAREQGLPLALATVVQVEGSAYRQPGARMLFHEHGRLAGSVSGGCLERDIVARGFFRTRQTGRALLSYDSHSDERRGTGCDGTVHVLLQRVEPDGFLQLAQRCLENEERVVLATVIRAEDKTAVGNHLALSADGSLHENAGDLASLLLGVARWFSHSSGSRLVQKGGLEIFVEMIEPPPHLFVFGSAHDAEALVQQAKLLGFSVSVCSEDGRAATKARFAMADRVLVGPAPQSVAELDRCARPLAVVMAHHYEQDLSALRALLPSRALYVGVLGAQRRVQRMLDDTGLSEPEQQLLGRLHAPVGLQLGAEGPQAIALSILAEAHAVLHGADARKRSQRARADGELFALESRVCVR